MRRAKKRAAEAPVRGRWREGVRKKAKSFVLPLPLATKAKGKCLSQREVRICKRSLQKLLICKRRCTFCSVHRCRLTATNAFQSSDYLRKGQLHFLFKIFPFAEFLVGRCCLCLLTHIYDICSPCPDILFPETPLQNFF